MGRNVTLDPKYEVIEFGDSYKAPPEETGKGVTVEGSTKKKGRTVAITVEDMQKWRNDVKARSTLLLALPDEHQLRFSKYDNAKELWEAILKTFGGNEATKKTKKNQLKAPIAIVSHLEFMDVLIEQDDLNQKFLSSLAPEWLVYTIVYIEQGMDLDTMSLDDVGKFEVPTIQGVSTTSAQTASVQVSTASTDVAAASLSYDTVCAFIATQPNGSQIKYEDITQIDDDDIEEMDIKWNLALLSMRADRFWKKTSKKITIQGSDITKESRQRDKKDPKVEEPAPKVMIAIDGIGWDWSYMAEKDENHALVADEEEVPTKYVLMAKSSSSSDNKICVFTHISDYGGANQDKKSTIRGCQFLGRRLISWQCKKQTIVATSTTEAEYVAAASGCGQVLWIQNQLLDYGYNFMNTKIYIDNNSAICIVKNHVYHSKTKHIEIRHHFIRDCYEKKLINVDHIHTDDNVADLLTKAFDVRRFQYLVLSIGMLNP
ncbi:hypothetical protein Tco_0522133 [Tanacetum coccineum]